MNKIFLVSSFIIIISWAVKAQELLSYFPNNYSVIPPSPEVSALMEYIDFPVSFHTGLPNITLPLYVVKEGALEVPISISYHGGGIKVYDQPGIVGLGWGLNAGGCVSRSVHGLPDDLNLGGDYGLHGLFHLKTTDNVLREIIMSRDKDNPYSPYNFTGQNEQHVLSETYCNDYNDGKSDMANDIFQFVAQQHSGTFIIDPETRHYVVNTSSPVKIVTPFPIYTSGGMTLVDDMFNQYFFDVTENTVYEYHRPGMTFENIDTIHYTSAWHLSKISDLMGDTIFFTYMNAGRKRLNVGHSQADFTYYPNMTGLGYDVQHLHTEHSHIVDYYPKLLSSINTCKQSVHFHYNSTFERLDSISVYRNTFPKERIRCIVFNYSDFDGSLSLEKYLLSINEKDIQDETELPLFTFEYKRCASPEIEDDWGYHSYPTADHGTLKSIIYPTGGYTKFSWEQNDYSFIGSQEVDSIVSSSVSYQLLTLSPRVSGRQITESNMGTGIFDSYTDINVNNNDTCRVTAQLYIKGFVNSLLTGPFVSCLLDNAEFGYQHGIYGIDSTYPRIEVQKPGGEIDVYYIDRQTIFNESAPDSIALDFTQSGTYRLSLKSPVNFTDVDASVINGLFIDGTVSQDDLLFKARINIKRTEIQGHVPPRWGGIRISSIISGEGSDIYSKKHYSYKDLYNPTKSSGTIIEVPYHNSTSYDCNYEMLTPNTQGDFVWTTIEGVHSDGLFMYPNGKSHVEYPYVKETINDTLCITYEFDSQRNFSINDISNALFYDCIHGGARINTPINHRCGNLLKRTILSNGLPVLENHYTYRIFENPISPLFCGDFQIITDARGSNQLVSGGEKYSCDYTTCRYQLPEYNKAIARERQIEYDYWYPQVPYIEVEHEFTFFRDAYSNEPNATFVRSDSYHNSDGTQYETFYSYVNINGHYINLLETEVTTCNGRIVKAKKYVYDDKCRLIATYRSPTNIPVRNEYSLNSYYYGASQELLSAINLPEFSYKYNPWGELVEVDYNGKVLSSFIWAYQGSHPVAEVKGVSYDELLQASPDGLFILDLHNRYDISESELNAIRQAFPSNEVVTLTYDWLVGVGTMTTPNGVTTKFSYDGLGRLSSIRDLNDYYIKRFEYHYAN